jgi:hypothetical protein
LKTWISGIPLATVVGKHPARPGALRVDTLTAAMSGNGSQHPQRPRIEIAHSAASPEEAAAIAAALEQFLRETAPAPQTERPALKPWLRAALYEGTGQVDPLA